MRKFLLLTSYFFIAPIVLFASFVFCLYLHAQTAPGTSMAALETAGSQNVLYASLPSLQSISGQEITQQDGRAEMIRQFFAKYGSPLEPYAQEIVDTADAYGLDFRLLPAIAMQESNLCKKAPEDSYNCWGFGIYGGKVTKFSDYSEAIQTVTKTLAVNYKKSGLDTPEEIMSRYTPSSNGSWARGVTHFMDALQ